MVIGCSVQATCKVVLTFEFMDEILKCDHSHFHIKATYSEQYFPVVLLIIQKTIQSG